MRGQEPVRDAPVPGFEQVDQGPTGGERLKQSGATGDDFLFT